METFDAPAKWFDSVQALPANGDTVFVIESKDQELAIWGDLAELDVQFAWPTVMTVFDK